MNILKNIAWGILTARGGSKSIPLKNIVPVCGKPLLSYNINAAKKAETISRIICSTDHPEISATAIEYGVEVLERPKHLGGDLVPSINVILNVVETLNKNEGAVAEIMVLLQPTSIFLKSSQIDDAVNALINNPQAKSSQCVVKVPHQFHAHNQRRIYDDGKDMGFVYEKERDDLAKADKVTGMAEESEFEKMKGFSKQTKPVHYTYGNLIVTRTEHLLKEKTFFCRPSMPIVIPLYDAYDLDSPDDIELAELLINNKLVHFD